MTYNTTVSASAAVMNFGNGNFASKFTPGGDSGSQHHHSAGTGVDNWRARSNSRPVVVTRRKANS